MKIKNNLISILISLKNFYVSVGPGFVTDRIVKTITDILNSEDPDFKKERLRDLINVFKPYQGELKPGVSIEEFVKEIDSFGRVPRTSENTPCKKEEKGTSIVFLTDKFYCMEVT